ncbi:MAG TPA: hypothetical protein PK514_07210 [Spirochaetota bacterium]|nr:hypothetical protein [Spirochaetota bacterium]
MAKLTLNPMFHNLRGSIGRIVHYNRYGMQYCRIHVIPSNPRTECQQAVRATFADAVRSWQQLSPDEKSVYNRKARYKPVKGYNLYISQFMKANMPAAVKKPDKGTQEVCSRFSHSTPEAFTSVATPLFIADSLYSPVTHGKGNPGQGS